MTGHPAVWTARIALLLSTLHVAAGQSSPEAFLYKELQSFEPKARFKAQTPKQRLHAYLLTLAGPATLVTEAGAAGLSQIVDSPAQWGQGAAGYGKRFANDMAYNGVRYSLAYGTSILLQEDDRYFASEQRGAWPRARHALASVFTAHKNDGRTVFATSSIVGIAGASLVSRAWSPVSWQTPSGTARSMGISIAGTAGFNLAREFLPDMARHLHK